MSARCQVANRNTIRIPNAGSLKKLAGSLIISQLVQRLGRDQGTAPRCRFILPRLSDPEAARSALTCFSEVASSHALLCSPETLLEHYNPRSDRQKSGGPLLP